MKIKDYLAMLDDAERRMHDAFLLLATHHAADADIAPIAQRLASWSADARQALRPAIERYGRARKSDTDDLYDVLFQQPRIGGFGQVRDLHDASLLVHHVYLCWTAVEQAAQALTDKDLIAVAAAQLIRTERRARWLRTHFKNGSAQALTVVPEKVSELKATFQNFTQRLPRPAAAVFALGALGLVAAAIGAAFRSK